MAHFAQLDENNIVIQVIVINNDDILIDGIENEQKGIDICTRILGGRWVQCSYNAKIRGCYPGIGFFYDLSENVFVPPKIIPSQNPIINPLNIS